MITGIGRGSDEIAVLLQCILSKGAPDCEKLLQCRYSEISFSFSLGTKSLLCQARRKPA